MIFCNYKVVFFVFVVIVLIGVVVIDVFVQFLCFFDCGSRGGSSKQVKVELLYFNVICQELIVKVLVKMGSKLQKMIDSYNKEKFLEMCMQVDVILVDSVFNEYDKLLVVQLVLQVVYQIDDILVVIVYLKQVIQFNGLDNNGYFQLMLMLGQLQLQEDQIVEGLVILDKYFVESKLIKLEELIVKGQVLYQLECYQEVILVLKQVIVGVVELKDNWNQLLMVVFFEVGQIGEVVQVVEVLVVKNLLDKKVQLNLVNMYMQVDQMLKVVVVMDKLCSSGQFIEECEYKQLYLIYVNIENKEKDVIVVINEGLQKGILKLDYQVYLVLVQFYYYFDQVLQVIDVWQKVVLFFKDGEIYLNLVCVLYVEGCVFEVKQVVQQVLVKGVKNQVDVKKIINLK